MDFFDLSHISSNALELWMITTGSINLTCNMATSEDGLMAVFCLLEDKPQVIQMFPVAS